MLARDPRYAEDPPARDIDFCNGGQGIQTFGQDLAWPVLEVEQIRFVHGRGLSTIHAFEPRVGIFCRRRLTVIAAVSAIEPPQALTN